jgi:uncharacterized membrane protein YcgQ (UPF0703/DUF1980 family)
MKLTDRQKELLQEDKYTLVDSIIILEHKLEKAVEEIQFIKNEMLLISESKDNREKMANKVMNRAMQDIEKQLDKAWEGNITSENFVDTVTKIFTGDYYDKDKKQTSTD